MTLTVRPLRPEDYPQWRPLWDGYTHFYECYLEESVTAATWERALSGSSSLFCRVAEKDGKVIGFAMCILHEGTWSTAPIAIWRICMLTQRNVAQARVRRLSTP